MLQLTHQRRMYQLHIIRCCTIIAFALERVNHAMSANEQSAKRRVNGRALRIVGVVSYSTPQAVGRRTPPPPRSYPLLLT